MYCHKKQFHTQKIQIRTVWEFWFLDFRAWKSLNFRGFGGVFSNHLFFSNCVLKYIVSRWALTIGSRLYLAQLFYSYKQKNTPQVGLEPTTYRLTAGCSAIELLRNIFLNLFNCHFLNGGACSNFWTLLALLAKELLRNIFKSI